MWDALLVRHGDLAAEYHRWRASDVSLFERRTNQWRGSWPLRADERKPPAVMIASRRCPSSFTSCSQPSPSHGSAQGETICRWTGRGISAGTALGGKAKLDMWNHKMARRWSAAKFSY